MGTTLTGLTPATTYDALIKVGDNGPLSATAKYVGDGLGNDSVLALSTNRVGIATFAPTQVLDVNGNMRLTGAFYDSGNAAGTSGQILSSTGTGTDWVSKSDLSLVDGSGTANYVSKWSDTDTLTNSIIYDNGSAVGIGTSSPTDILHLNRSGASVYNAIHYTNPNSTADFYVGIGGSSVFNGSLQNNAYILNASASDLILGTSDTERLRITAAGLVGIGTSSPNRLLTIKNSSDGVNGLSFQSYASTSELGYIRYEQTNDILDIVNTSGFASGGIKFSTSNTERMRITSAGNVGIGTSSPSAKLDVSASTDLITKFTRAGIGAWGVNVNSSGDFFLINRFDANVFEITDAGVVELSQGQIQFPSTQVASANANTLDDYEEGTWTPVINGGGGNPTVTYSAFNTGGIYTKIGNQVTVSFEVRWSAISGGSGGVAIAGLPFARRTTSLPDGDRLIIDSYDNTISGKYLTGSIGSGNSSIAFSMVNSAAAPTDLVVSDLSTSGLGFLRGTATYFV